MASETQSNNEEQYFSEEQLAAVLNSLEDQETQSVEKRKLSQEELDKIAKAWSKVKRDKLFKQ